MSDLFKLLKTLEALLGLEKRKPKVRRQEKKAKKKEALNEGGSVTMLS